MKNVLLILMLFVVLTAWSQEANEQNPKQGQEIPLSLLIVTRGTGLSSGQVRVFHELALARVNASFYVNLIETDAQSSEGIREIADRTAADSWLELRLAQRGKSVEVRAELYVRKQEQRVAEHTLSTEQPFSDLDETFWKALLENFKSHLRPLRQEIVYEETIEKKEEQQTFVHRRGTSITVLALPGTRLAGLIPERLLIGETGRLTVEVPQQVTYKIKAVHWRFESAIREVFVGTEPVEVQIDQQSPQRIALSLFADLDRASGIGIMAYILPDRIFAEFRFENSFLGIMPEFWHVNSVDWLARNLSGSLSFGYFLNSSSPVRIAIGLGGLIRWHSPPPDSSFRLNHLFPAGWIFSLLLEARITEKFKGFIEWAPEFYLVRTIPESIFDPGSVYENMSWDDWDELQYSKVLYTEMSRFRIGVRYYF